jgi:hypothetical protein
MRFLTGAQRSAGSWTISLSRRLLAVNAAARHGVKENDAGFYDQPT